MTRRVCRITCLLLPFLVCVSRASTDPDDAIRLLEGAVQTIDSFDVQVDLTTRILMQSEMLKDRYVDENGRKRAALFRSRKLRPNEAPVIQRQRIRQVYQQGKGRIEFLGSSGNLDQVFAYDGELAKSRDVKSAEASIRKPPLSVIIQGGDYRESYKSLIGRLSLLKCLQDRRSRDCVLVTGPTDNSPLLTVEAQPLPKPWSSDMDLHEWGFRVRLDPRHGMLPAMIELDQPINGRPHLYRRTTVNEWKSLGNGVWVPVRVTSEIFVLDVDNRELFGQVGNEIVLVVDVSRSSWNKKIPGEALDVRVPAGTKVTDMERGVRYVTGKADPGTNLEALAADARDVAPIHVTSGPIAKAWPPWLIYGGMGLAILILARLAWYLWKRRFAQVS